MCDVLLLGSVPHLEKRETIVLFLHIVVRDIHILSEHGLIVMSHTIYPCTEFEQIRITFNIPGIFQ